MGVTTAGDLSRVLAAVGLAQNLGALRALSTEGINRGHLRLHQRNLEMAAHVVTASAWSAPGKLMLFGEYAVLEGHPSLALCFDARMRCAARAGGGDVRFDARASCSMSP